MFISGREFPSKIHLNKSACTKCLLRVIARKIVSNYCIASSPPSHPENMRSTAACKGIVKATPIEKDQVRTEACIFHEIFWHLQIPSHNLQSLESQAFIYNTHLPHSRHLLWQNHIQQQMSSCDKAPAQ